MVTGSGSVEASVDAPPLPWPPCVGLAAPLPSSVLSSCALPVDGKTAESLAARAEGDGVGVADGDEDAEGDGVAAPVGLSVVGMTPGVFTAWPPAAIMVRAVS